MPPKSDLSSLVYLWVALGSALGGVARFWAAGFVGSRLGAAFPFGTIIVNITGCFVIGLFAGLTGTEGRVSVPAGFRQFFMVGICGGYTTFSSFSLQTLDLARAGEWPWAGLNVFGSVAGCLLAVWLGQAAAMLINPRR